MNEKHLKIFGGVFVFLLILFIVTKPRHAGVKIDELVQTILIGISKEDVKTIEIYKQTTGQPVQLTFQRNDKGSWRIPTHLNCKAKMSRVDQLLIDLIEMTGKVRSSDPKFLESYAITDEGGLHLLLKGEGDKPLANLILGKPAEDYGTGFVRFADKEKVYAVDKNLLSSLGIHGELDTLSMFNPTSFIDLQAVDQNQNDLEILGAVTQGRELILKRIEKEVEAEGDSAAEKKKEVEWKLVRGRAELLLDQAEAKKCVQDLTRINSLEVVDRLEGTFEDMEKSTNYGFNRPQNYLVYRKPDGNQENAIFGKQYEKDGGYYMLVQSDGLIYKVSRSVYDSIFKWVTDLPKKIIK